MPRGAGCCRTRRPESFRPRRMPRAGQGRKTAGLRYSLLHPTHHLRSSSTFCFIQVLRVVRSHDTIRLQNVATFMASLPAIITCQNLHLSRMPDVEGCLTYTLEHTQLRPKTELAAMEPKWLLIRCGSKCCRAGEISGTMTKRNVDCCSRGAVLLLIMMQVAGIDSGHGLYRRLRSPVVELRFLSPNRSTAVALIT